MVTVQNNLFTLNTKNTTYCFRVLDNGYLEHLYYGAMIDIISKEAIYQKQIFNQGNQISYSKEYIQLGLETMDLEISGVGKGDIREPFVEIVNVDGSLTNDFVFDSYELSQRKEQLNTLPSSYDETNQVMELKIKLFDKDNQIELILFYWVYEDCDVISRSAKVINKGSEKITVERLMSTQIDFDNNKYIFDEFHGGWIDEMNRTSHLCEAGILVNSSTTGTSSSRSNPFVIIRKTDTTEDFGESFGFNLIYSGNHYEVLDIKNSGQMRFISGINPRNFAYELEKDQMLEAPEAVMTFSEEGLNGMSQNMHYFIREHIVRGSWKKKERPILINSWEASYFNFNKESLLNLARKAKDIGIELFVLDDGWFGKRNDDKSSLGDWKENLAKLPGGLKGLSDELEQIGLSFGIWVEPEMVSEDSVCFREHPNWAVEIPGKMHAEGRNQKILDLTQKEVRQYITNEMTAVFSSCNISYVKWDMNRIFSDCYSQGEMKFNQKEFAHRYVCGLYEILDRLVKAFPNILFEGCAAGGNRFDLGMLCYMPQIWGSDNTDALCRAKIQTGYSYGYPMSVVTAHVSACPNHQTYRTINIETRFQISCFGILGYECDFSKMKEEELELIKKQIDFYKQNRAVLQYGNYYRNKNGENDQTGKGIYLWNVVSKELNKAITLYLKEQTTIGTGYANLKVKGLDDFKTYSFYNREIEKKIGEMTIPAEKEKYIVSGNFMRKCGIKLQQDFCAIGYENGMRVLLDGDSRIYVLEETSI